MVEQLPVGWKQRTLGEIAEINPRNVEIPVSEDMEVSFVPMAAVSEITASITAAETRQLSEVRKGFTPFREEDVLFAKITPCMENGKIAIAHGLVNGLGFGSTEFHIIRPSTDVSNRWIWYFLRNPATRRYAAQNMTGSAGQQRVPTEFVRMLQLPVPPTLEKQEHIADLLDEVDAACLICDQLQKEIEHFISALFIKMFGNPETNPKGWQIVTLDQYSEVVGGLQVTPKRNSGDSIPYLRVANVYRDRLDLTEIKSMLVSSNELRSRTLYRGDVLVVEGHGNPNELGRAAVWNGAITRCVHQNHLIRIRPDNYILKSEYLSRLINSSYGRNYFLRVGNTTSGLNTISSRVVKDFPVLLPPPELQDNFVNIIHAYEDHYREQTEMISTLEMLRLSLMDRIFNNRRVVLLEVENKTEPIFSSTINRAIWPRLSATQQHLWGASQTFTTSFKVEELSERVRAQQGKVPSSEYVQTSMELLEVLTIVVKENRRDVEKWRLPDDETDPDIEV